MRLPTAEDINPFQDPDGQVAEQHFCGKSLEQAEALFREAPMTHQEDLMFMGASAFRFYVQAATNYIRSDWATGDADIINAFANILDLRMEYQAEELQPIASWLADICSYIVEHYDRFDLTPAAYGDLRPRYHALQQTFLQQMETVR